jgi:hypothetical protein
MTAEAEPDVTAHPPMEVPEGIVLEEGAVVQMYDHDRETKVWIKIRNLFESEAAGPALTGYQYKTEECNQHDYEGTRSIPLDQLVDPAEERLRVEAKKEHARAGRVRRSGSGVCEHCGEPTGGGRFLAGHDAKLKSILATDAMNPDEHIAAAAFAESQIRATQHKEDDPQSSKWWLTAPPALKKEVARLAKQGDGFLRSRIAQRTGTDPGRIDDAMERAGELDE